MKFSASLPARGFRVWGKGVRYEVKGVNLGSGFGFRGQGEKVKGLGR